MFDYFFSDMTSAYHASHVGKMGLGDGGDGTAGWSDMLLQGMVGYGCRHSAAISVSGSVGIQRGHACRFAILGKTFCRRPSEICCAQFDSKAVQKVPTKAAFHRHFPALAAVIPRPQAPLTA